MKNAAEYVMNCPAHGGRKTRRSITVAPERGAPHWLRDVQRRRHRHRVLHFLLFIRRWMVRKAEPGGDDQERTGRTRTLHFPGGFARVFLIALNA